MWLTEILKQHEEFEAPLSFWYWSALAAIAAVAKDNIWIDRYLYKLYPNIYVMLHASSGLKKGPPISMAEQMVHEVNNTTIMAGRFSIQGLLKKMSTAESLPGGKIKDNSNIFICASEMTSSIVSDPAAMDILTFLYDRNYRNAIDYESILKMESFKIKKPTITMLTATNEAHSEDFFIKKDIQGGYIARTFIIYENRRNKTNSLAFPPAHIPNYKESAKYLLEIAKLKGEFEWPQDSREYYDTWYKQFISAIDEHEIVDPTGTLNRFGDSVLKVAMLTALSKEPKLYLPKEAVETAIKRCETLVGNVRRTTIGRGKSSHAQEIAILLKELVKREPHMISKRLINEKYWPHANAQTWDEICEQLIQAGAITMEQHGEHVMFVMPESQVEKWKAHFEGK